MSKCYCCGSEVAEEHYEERLAVGVGGRLGVVPGAITEMAHSMANELRAKLGYPTIEEEGEAVREQMEGDFPGHKPQEEAL